MKTVKITFWSDFVSQDNLPKDTFRNLTAKKIREMMKDALLAHGSDGDIWAHKQVISRNEWTEEHFVFVRKDDRIWEEDANE